MATNPYGALNWDPTKTKASDIADIAGTMQGPESYKPDDSALVSSQLTSLLSKDSPWTQRARAKASEYANSRGLLNSSMAATAGEAAAIDAALPVAQADANTNFTSQRDNWAAKNEFARDSNAFLRQGALGIAQGGMAARENELGRSLQLDLQNRQQNLQRELQTGQQSWQSAENQTQRAHQLGVLGQEQAFTTKRDTSQFQNRLQEIQALTQADLQRIDQQNGTNLSRDYRVASEGLYSEYARDATRIQESDMDPDVKQQQIAQLGALYTSRQVHLNTIFSNQPAWNSEWAQFALEFGGE